MCLECFKGMLMKSCVNMPGDQLHLWAPLQLSHFPKSCCSNMVIAKNFSFFFFLCRWNSWPWQIVECRAELVTWKQHGSTSTSPQLLWKSTVIAVYEPHWCVFLWKDDQVALLLEAWRCRLNLQSILKAVVGSLSFFYPRFNLDRKLCLMADPGALFSCPSCEQEVFFLTLITAQGQFILQGPNLCLRKCLPQVVFAENPAADCHFAAGWT